MIVYHVGVAQDGSEMTVVKLPTPPHADDWRDLGLERARPTLHGIGSPDGRTCLALPGGLCVELEAEAFDPYQATVRLSACAR